MPSILHQSGSHWVEHDGRAYRVWRDIGTHSVLRATIGYHGAQGLRRAIDECERREREGA